MWIYMYICTPHHPSKVVTIVHVHVHALHVILANLIQTQRRSVTIFNQCVLAVDFNVHTHNPGQHAESAKPLHVLDIYVIWCDLIIITFREYCDQPLLR